MSMLKLLGAVAVLSTLSAVPVSAQAVISEPGYCAFFYPSANCQNKGPGNPYGNYQQPYGNYQQPAARANNWSGGKTVGVTSRRSRAYRSAARMR
jgi:hypothetical protein